MGIKIAMLAWLGQFILEVVAVFFAVELSNRWSKYQEKKHQLDLCCDSCKKPLKLRQTKDKKFYLCYKCTRLYRAELKAKALEANPDISAKEE